MSKALHRVVVLSLLSFLHESTCQCRIFVEACVWRFESIDSVGQHRHVPILIAQAKVRPAALDYR